MTNNAYNMINLQGSGVNPATFSGAVYKPLAPNIALLDKSLTTLAAKKDEIAKGQAAVDQAFGQLENQMHKDPETRAWMNAYKEQLMTPIEERANEMDLYGAARQATLAAGELTSNGVILDRIAANKEYTAMEDEVTKSKDYNKDVKDWFLANNPYEGSMSIDDNGIEHYDHPEYNNRPAKQLDYTDIIKTAQATLRERGSSLINSSGRVLKKDKNGKYVPSDETTIFDSKFDWKGVDANRLQEAIDSAFDLTDGAKESIVQDYKVDLWKYSQLMDKIKKAKDVNEKSRLTNELQVYKNRLFAANDGHLYDINEYRNVKVLPWISSMSYGESTTFWGEHKQDKDKGYDAALDALKFNYTPTYGQSSATVKLDFTDKGKEMVKTTTGSASTSDSIMVNDPEVIDLREYNTTNTNGQGG